ncbi:MAG: heavy-metal-associated domain-containing protein [Bacteroidota bacterium]
MKKFFAFLAIVLLVSACGGEQKKNNAEDNSANVNMAAMTNVTFQVEGMTCEGCQNAIGKSVSSLNGIGEVVSSYQEGWTRVTFDSTTTTEDAIIEKIAAAGYTVLGKKDLAEPSAE